MQWHRTMPIFQKRPYPRLRNASSILLMTFAQKTYFQIIKCDNNTLLESKLIFVLVIKLRCMIINTILQQETLLPREIR